MDENRIYTTVQGDMWDSIAYHFYGDVKYIGLLLQNNLDLLTTFEELSELSALLVLLTVLLLLTVL